MKKRLNLVQKWRFINENFDEYLASEYLQLTDDQMRKLPEDLAFKISKGKRGLITSKLHFLQQMYFLYKAKSKRAFLVIEDEENGFTLEQFVKYKEEFKKRKPSIADGEEFIMNHGFCFGARELIESLDYMNMLSVGNAYKYALKVRNSGRTAKQVEGTKEAMENLIKMLKFYEGNKKIMAVDMDISVAQWYMLMHLFTGEKKGSDAYNIVFKYAFNATKEQMIHGVTDLHRRGYIEMFGSGKWSTYRILPAGVELVNKIFQKYILDY